jgi:hypothetical protein
MHSGTFKRLRALEEHAGITTEPPPIVIVSFGDYVEYRGRTSQRWDRQEDETDNALQSRVMDDLEASGHRGKFIWLCFTDKPTSPPIRA